MSLTHVSVVVVCLAVGIAATVADIVFEVTGHSGFDPQPIYVFLALVLGQQGAKVSTERGKQRDPGDPQ